MAPASIADLQGYASRVAGATHDAYSQDALARAVDEYVGQRQAPIASIRPIVGGTAYPSLYAALEDPRATFTEAELALVEPPPSGPAWEWTLPFERITFSADGAATIHPLGGGPGQRAIARLLRREYYVPRTQATADAGTARLADPRPGLLPLGPSVDLLRSATFVPFGVALLLYAADERYRIEIDLLGSAVVRDPRAGRLSVQRRVRRTSRVAHDVDVFIARGELAVRTARVLEMLTESHGLTPFEVSHVFGGVREFGSSALRTLQARDLATLDRKTGLFRPRFDRFRTHPGDAPGGAAGPLPNPALRTSVAELLAAADSRATCPLCGDPLPPGPRGILCARCESEVGAADDAPL